MKFSINLLLLICFPLPLVARDPAEGVVVRSLASDSLVNDFGEDPTREIAVYLPDGYHESARRYPVVYFLHGFNGDHRILGDMAALLDSAIRRKKIRPFIMVVSNQKTAYGGSFYSNSGVFGNWEDFTALDVVAYVDKNYRTIASREGRGIAGHSMGGYGALKVAMHHPDRFCAVYALSPGGLAVVKEYGPDSDTYRELSEIKTDEQLGQSYFGQVAIAFGKSWSPNPNKPPFYCDVPFTYLNQELVVDQEVLNKWHRNMPYYMIDDHIEKLKQLNASKLDWGRNAGDRFTLQCEKFSRKLENAGIEHFAEEYIGTHSNNIYTESGRIPNQLLPFFNDYLVFQE
ncbi:MAG: alpha/beta hydrolase-fold protein [Rubripirellula sp.]